MPTWGAKKLCVALALPTALTSAREIYKAKAVRAPRAGAALERAFALLAQFVRRALPSSLARKGSGLLQEGGSFSLCPSVCYEMAFALRKSRTDQSRLAKNVRSLVSGSLASI